MRFLDDARVRMGLVIVGGLAAIAGAAYVLFFAPQRVDKTKVNAQGQPLSPGEQSQAAVEQEVARKDCYNLHYKANLLDRQGRTAEANDVRKEAAAAGCLWATETT